jgi:hypothetical protein
MMEIGTAVALKIELADSIKTAIDEYQTRTGLVVKEISLMPINTIGGQVQPPLVTVSVSI